MHRFMPVDQKPVMSPTVSLSSLVAGCGAEVVPPLTQRLL